MPSIWFICYNLVVVGLSAYGLHRFWIVFLYLRRRRNAPKPLNAFAELPTITVQLPIYNEMYVAERLLRAVAALEYPREKLEVQALDDSTDETTAIIERVATELRSQGLNIHHIRRGSRSGFKAGALAHGLKIAQGEFCAIFDADFLPPPKTLLETVHYFTDPKVGMIQTRWGHLNQKQNLLTRVQALMLDGHLLIEQTARHRNGRFFNFNGTAGIWRKSCILDAGGWHTDTLTEDLDLSYRAQLAGWQFVFLPHLITPAELPAEMNAFKVQQHRWAKGAIQTCLKLLPTVWRSKLPLAVKLEASFHLTSNFAYLLLAAMCFLLQPSWTRADITWHSFLWVDLPIFMVATFSLFVFYGLVLWESGKAWWKIPFYVPALISVGVGLSINNAKAVLEALFHRPSEFIRTPKYGDVSSQQRRKYFSSKSILLLVEMSLALYYAHFVWFAWRNQLWTSLPFLILFALGFFYVALSSLFHRRLIFQPSPSRA
ncbi:MAG: cellulose synthase family protein [bacterium]